MNTTKNIDESVHLKDIDIGMDIDTDVDKEWEIEL